MLKGSKVGEVVFCDLVEHPGGHDGGEFPQEEVFSLHKGTLFYSTGYPRSVCNDFENYGEGEDKDAFVHCPTKSDALERLRLELKEAEDAVAQLKLLVAAAADESVGYTVLWEGDDGSEEDDPHHAYEDEDDEE